MTNTGEAVSTNRNSEPFSDRRPHGRGARCKDSHP
jgi:hypothetical protein